MHPVVVVFALMVGEETGGLIGAVLAVPIASIVQAIFLYFRRRQAAPELAREA
jgi:predicted PurR-regulated permease PerM